ncbi:adenylate cyclase, partial [bacterium CG17_big_fil_post_rev_8_21_14_2_50_64_8]
VSRYHLAPVAQAAPLLATLQAALPVLGVVAKTRRLLMCGRTRIHLDEVEGLGSFLELEVVLAEGESVADGEREAHRMLAELGIPAEDLVEGAYLDLIVGRAQP